MSVSVPGPLLERVAPLAMALSTLKLPAPSKLMFLPPASRMPSRLRVPAVLVIVPALLVKITALLTVLVPVPVRGVPPPSKESGPPVSVPSLMLTVDKVVVPASARNPPPDLTNSSVGLVKTVPRVTKRPLESRRMTWPSTVLKRFE